jgi:hypothetical protein
MLLRSVKPVRDLLFDIKISLTSSTFSFGSSGTIEDVYWNPSDHSEPWPLPDTAQNYTGATIVSPGFYTSGHGVFDHTGVGIIYVDSLDSSGAVIQSTIVGDLVGISTTYSSGNNLQLFKATAKYITGFRVRSAWSFNGTYSGTFRNPLTLIVTAFNA